MQKQAKFLAPALLAIIILAGLCFTPSGNVKNDPGSSPLYGASLQTAKAELANGLAPEGAEADQKIRIERRAGTVTERTCWCPTITLTPINPPIQIPATGGSFDYNVSLMTTGTFYFDVWYMIQLPSGTWHGPVEGPVHLRLSASFPISRSRSQNVPASAPPGDYQFEGRIGRYPNSINDSSSFPFTKLTTGGSSRVDDWKNYGEPMGSGKQGCVDFGE